MKIVRRTAGLAVLAFAAAAALPAQAAGPFTIKGGPGSAASSGVTLLTAAKGPACSETVAHHPGQGIDSVILDGRAYAGGTARIDWAAERPFGGGIDATFFDAGCSTVFYPGIITSSRQPGAWFVAVPPSTRWIVVSSSLALNVTFHINRV